MTPKLFTAVMLFISAYSPLFVILIVKNFDFSWLEYPIIYIISIMIFLVVLSIVVLLCSVSHMVPGNMKVQVTSIKYRSADLISYTIPYIVLFIGADLSKLGDIISLIIFLLMMMLITIRSETVFFNPVLLMCGYNMYDIEYLRNKRNGYAIVLSKNRLKRGDFYYIRSISEFIYFVKEPPKNDNEQQ